MMTQLSWIWLSPVEFPDVQTAVGERHQLVPPFEGKLAPKTPVRVAEFRREVRFPHPVSSLRIFVSADTTYRLSVNGSPVSAGPAPAACDWLPSATPPPWHADETTWTAPNDGVVVLHAVVMLGEVAPCDVTFGHGGFAMCAEATLADGSFASFETDESWQCRPVAAWRNESTWDDGCDDLPWTSAVRIEDRWHATPAPIPVRSECLVNGGDMVVEPGASVRHVLEMYRVLAGDLVIHGNGPCSIAVTPFEVVPGDRGRTTRIRRARTGGWSLRIPFLQSIGGVVLQVENTDKTTPLQLGVAVASMEYPVSFEAAFECSDPDLTEVFRACCNSLRICRQQMHLDSPLHQEPLACTGDYYIETLMTVFTFGDLRLARFDALRTARLLEERDGRLFHTSYSLLWVRWIADLYVFTGDVAMLRSCEPALRLLLRRFDSYVGETGLVETPPDFMFVDWTISHGFSMHHPPKGLGQTVLCSLYHRALRDAVAIYGVLGDESSASLAGKRADDLREACRRLLWSQSERRFRSGLSTPSPNTNKWLPQTPDGFVAFTTHADVMAVYGGLVEGEDARDLVRRLFADGLGDIQPYFMHFAFEAADSCGIFDEVAMPMLRRWIPMVRECGGKGIAEGWIAPEPSYSFDHSHAWGGTPAWQLPARLLGLRMLEPGFRRIALAPRSLGLSHWSLTIPTPFGPLSCTYREGSPPTLSIPPGIAPN